MSRNTIGSRRSKKPPADNFEVERFDDIEKRDARYRELKDRGRAGLLKLSVGDSVTVQELHKFPPGKRLVNPGPACGFIERKVDVVITVPVWAVAYPRKMPVKKRRRSRTFEARPLQSKRHKRSRWFRRHPVKAGNFGSQHLEGHWITGRPVKHI